MTVASPRCGRRAVVGGGLALLATAGARAQSTRDAVDSAGRTLALPARVERVFAAGPPAAILLYALAPERLLGWTSAFREQERPFVPPRYASLPGLGRLTGRGNSANVEAVLAARPDLILDYGAVNPTYVSLADRTQQQTGIPYALIDGAIDRIPDAFRMLGELIGEKARGEDLATYVAGMLADIDRRLAALPPGRKPRVYYARGPRGLETGLAGSINVEGIERLRAENVAAAMGAGGLATVSLEQILLWDPDVIVTIDTTFYAAVRRDPLWRALRAVASDRVYLAPSLPFGWVDFPPAVNRLVGLRWLAKILYPAAFAEDLRPFVRDFYARFYHQAPSDAQLDQLLADSR